MDIIVLYRGQWERPGIAWHIRTDFTSLLIAMHRKSGVSSKTSKACKSPCSLTSHPEAYKNQTIPFSLSRCQAIEGLWVMWLAPWLPATLSYINSTWRCNRNLKRYKYWRIKIIYGTLRCKWMCVSACVCGSVLSPFTPLLQGETLGSGGASWEFCNCFFCPWSRSSCFKSKKAISVSNGSINN